MVGHDQEAFVIPRLFRGRSRDFKRGDVQFSIFPKVF